MSLKKILKNIPSNRNQAFTQVYEIKRNEDLAIVLHTCDSYSFCWEGWLHFLKKNMQPHLPAMNVYFMNEEQAVHYDNIIHLPTGTGEWSDRLLKGLSQIKERHVLYMQEDFWPTCALDIQENYTVFRELDMNALRVCEPSTYYSLYKPFVVSVAGKKFPIQKFANRSNYLVSHQASIWKKNFFMSCLTQSENPWVNEKEGTIRLRKQKQDLKIYMRSLKWYNAVCRGGQIVAEGKTMLQEVEQANN